MGEEVVNANNIVTAIKSSVGVITREKTETSENVIEIKGSSNCIVKYISDILISPKSDVKRLTAFAENMLWFRSLNHGNEFMGFDSQGRNLDDFIIKDGLSNFEEFLKNFGFDFNLVALPGPSNMQVIGTKYNSGVIAIFEEIASTGILSLRLFYHWYKKLSNVSFLFIDEFDAFYNGEISIAVIKLLNSLRHVQTIVTTHNETLLSIDGVTRPDCSFVIANNNILPLSRRTNKELREAHNIENIYRKGGFDLS